MAQGGSTVVVVQQPTFSDNPVQVACPTCNNTVITTTTKKSGLFTYIMICVCCLLCFPCFWVPLVMDSCKDTVHTCPGCKAPLGEKRRL